ncbi:MAG: hypothetical protein WBF08_06645 [Candidatus Bathyarchaeia archaeon]
MSFKSIFLAILPLTIILFSILVLPYASAFTVNPTMDLTTSSNMVGATDAVYSFHSENPNTIFPQESIVIFTVLIPTGYSVNPAYLTTTPDIVVMTGVYGVIGQPISGYLRLNTTGVSGLFVINAKRISPPTVPAYVPIGTAQIVPPTMNAPGSWSVTLGAPNTGEYIDLSFVAGFFINPSTPGVYVWAPSIAQAGDASTASMDPRPGFTNEIRIMGPPVGGLTMTVDKLELLIPYLGLAGLIAAVSTVIIIRRRRG